MKPLRKLAHLPAYLRRLIDQGKAGEWDIRVHEPAVKILGAYSTPDMERLIGSSLDIQHGGLSAYSIPLGGWAVGRTSPVKSISILSNDLEVTSSALEHPRPDVAQHMNMPETDKLGFLINVKTLGLDPTFTLNIYAILEDNERALLGHLDCKQEPLRPGFKPELNPILVTFMGRTGSTWLMRLLSEHPQIVIHREYPYETRPLRYWLHVLRVLASPADHQHSAAPVGFVENEFWIGQNPFHTPNTFTDSGLRYWMGQKSTNQLAKLCLLNIDMFYRHLRRSEGRQGARYFAEKSVFTIGTRLTRQLYPNAREIILVRDPRDVFASVQSFNARRGTQGFKSDRYPTPEAYLRFTGGRMAALARLHDLHPDETYLLRYEDLILRPNETLTEVFRYLRLDSSPLQIAALLEQASQDTPEMEQHRTTNSPASSIGRWRRDLTPEIQETAHSVLGDVLKTLGYEV